MSRLPLALLLAGLIAIVAAPVALAQDEDANLAKSEERAREHQTEAYQAELRARSAENARSAAIMQATDPERTFVSDVCWHGGFGCAGDIRLYDFEERRSSSTGGPRRRS